MKTTIIGASGFIGRNIVRKLEELKLSKVHTFKYSKREGTKAAAFDYQVPEKIKDERAKEMHLLGEKLHEDFLKRFIGGEERVLMEKKLEENRFEGHGESYLKVEVTGKAMNENEIVNVKILGEKDGILLGEKIEGGI